MFTGIITGIGEIKQITPKTPGICVEIQTPETYLKDSNIGDSISINGICTTITKIEENVLTCDYLEETLNITTAKYFKIQEKVNLELAANLKTFLGGHMLSGHIDCRAKVKSLKKDKAWGKLIVECPEKDQDYLIQKGSISINGISLTIADLDKHIVSIELIPHTLEKTNLLELKENSLVNIEYDMLGKYVTSYIKKHLK